MFQSKLLFEEKKTNKIFMRTLIKFYRIIPDSWVRYSWDLLCQRVHFNKLPRNCPKAADTYQQQNGIDYIFSKSETHFTFWHFLQYILYPLKVSSWYFCVVSRLSLTLHAMIIRTLWFPWWQDANVWLLENNLIRAALSQGAASKKTFSETT